MKKKLIEVDTEVPNGFILIPETKSYKEFIVLVRAIEAVVPGQDEEGDDCTCIMTTSGTGYETDLSVEEVADIINNYQIN